MTSKISFIVQEELLKKAKAKIRKLSLQFKSEKYREAGKYDVTVRGNIRNINKLNEYLWQIES